MSSAFGDVQDEQKAQNVELSENKADDLVTYFRGNIVGHEEEALLMFFSILSGYGYDDSFHNNCIGQGPPGSGKSLTKNKVRNLMSDRDTYTKTDASSNAILDSVEWDLAIVAVLDEYDKIDKNIVEVLKSSNPEDGGYAKDRNVEDSDARGGYSPTEVSADPNPWIVLYAPSSKKGGINEELADRALKLHFSNDKFTRRAIGRKEFGHENININSDEYDEEYIYDTHELAAALRQHIRNLPTQTHYEEDEDGERHLVSRTGDTIVYEPKWVWYAVEPIFNISEDSTNRVYGTVMNLIKASAMFNHDVRPTKEVEIYDSDDEDDDTAETREAVVIQPQDVANILSCFPALLSTTHQLTPLKRHLLDAIDATEPMTDADGTTVTKVQQYLEDNDIPHPTRQTLKSRLDDLAEEYYLNRYKSVAGPKGQADAYEKASQGALKPPRINSLQTHADRDDVELGKEDCVNVDPSDPFKECHDPIRDKSFVDTVSQFRADFTSSGSEPENTLVAAMGSGDGDEYVSSDSNGGGQTGEDGGSQSSLTDSTNGEVEDNTEYDGSIEDVDGEPQNPTQQYLLEQLRENKGEMFAVSHEVIQKMGVVDTDENPQQVDLGDTVADPDHELWQNRTDLASDRVISQEDALRELEQAYSSLKQNGFVEEDTDRAPPAMCRLNTV